MWVVIAVSCGYLAGRFIWYAIYENGDKLEIDRETAERLKKELDDGKQN